MLLRLNSVSKHYQLGDTKIRALDDITVEIERGEFVAIMGPSGSGKSTFLQVASMLATPTGGEIYLKDIDVTQYNEVERAQLRNKEIGFIFQQFNLLAKTSTLDNVRLPLIYAGVSEREQKRRSIAMIERVGLLDRINNGPAQLSGGQQQRVAIARALINEPAIIFADEPTGNLDSKSGDEIMKLLVNLHKEGKTIIMVTHETEIADFAQRLITFHDGEIISDTKKRTKKKTPKKRKASK
ncbi:MAG: ABC transporter ATP-binding protein [Candidatus Pacebacteria bacterium]|nr:ABC transporter ATP-binding protein [Candidatus Paceibacterota bacterium]PIR64142.1 MAG: macrolide ABC transporter ATP-binding protein [Candidatus Pacebacteria bacterium CG10_big_fil_rev_8_21_14_0_10_40_26]PIZ79333.1 MAG: macrolide ABC transporter ATP-binding protein [Candidatus Pacebacteria bacterium CG_4_10_14_0_2_um_filter_40_20]PJA68989.1 MAG: macrolide ABC transporter ATP-binding protein [Candidatus Pacebacteria bacterium CG_4_9_14_3_um_filter_40_12]PJC42300.1 MAG: macrolide ABC transpo